MTGFGSADGEVGGARVSIEIRSVNHRFFNPSVKLPSELARWEGEVREALRKGVARGHVTLFARADRRVVSQPHIDVELFGAYVEQLRDLQKRYALSAMVDVGTVLRMPNVVTATDVEATGTAAELVAIVERAVAALDEMRVAEGTRLAAYLEERLAVIEAAVHRIAERAPHRLTEQRDRLRETIRELAQGISVDEQRLAQEVAILADRLDVGEEVSRFHSHFAAFRAALASPPADGVGKRLGFLLQELLREANTAGSKANDAAMLHDVIVIKEELERVREQVENLE